jgi:hypothetical protein
MSYLLLQTIAIFVSFSYFLSGKIILPLSASESLFAQTPLNTIMEIIYSPAFIVLFLISTSYLLKIWNYLPTYEFTIVTESAIYSIDLVKLQIKKNIFYEVEKIIGPSFNHENPIDDDFLRAILLQNTSIKIIQKAHVQQYIIQFSVSRLIFFSSSLDSYLNKEKSAFISRIRSFEMNLSLKPVNPTALRNRLSEKQLKIAKIKQNITEDVLVNASFLKNMEIYDNYILISLSISNCVEDQYKGSLTLYSDCANTLNELQYMLFPSLSNKLVNSNNKKQSIKKSLEKELLNSVKSNITLSNKLLATFLVFSSLSFYQQIPAFSSNKASIIQNSNNLILGSILQNDVETSEISLPINDLKHNIEVVGMIGRGKTSFVINILNQLICKSIGTLVLDVKGEYASQFSNFPSVDVLSLTGPSKLSLNLFELKDETDAHSVLNLLSEIFRIVGTELTPAMYNLLEDGLNDMVSCSNPTYEEFVKKLNFHAHKYSMKGISYITQTLDGVINRFKNLLSPGIRSVITSNEKPLDLSSLDRGRTVIVDLSHLQRAGSRVSDLFLLTNLITQKLYNQASKYGNTPDLRYVVILEEAMYSIPKISRNNNVSLSFCENLFILGRSLGVGTISIYQLWSTISPVVHANSSTKVIFRSAEDVERISLAISLSFAQKNYLRQIPIRQFLFVSANNEPLLARSLEVKIKHSSHSPLNQKEERKNQINPNLSQGSSLFPVLENNENYCLFEKNCSDDGLDVDECYVRRFKAYNKLNYLLEKRSLTELKEQVESFRMGEPLAKDFLLENSSINACLVNLVLQTLKKHFYLSNEWEMNVLFTITRRQLKIQ